jgi:hypothetical protein
MVGVFDIQQGADPAEGLSLLEPIVIVLVPAQGTRTPSERWGIGWLRQPASGPKRREVSMADQIQVFLLAIVAASALLIGAFGAY